MTIEIGIIGFLGLGLLAGLWFRHRRKARELELQKKQPIPISISDFNADPRHTLPLGREILLGGGRSFEVVAIDHCFNSEDGEPQTDGEDWWTVTLRDMDGNLYYLSVSEDDEEVPFWVLSEEVQGWEKNAMSWVSTISFDEDSAPPESIDLRTELWTTVPNEHDYEVYVESWHSDRDGMRGYHALMTEWFAPDHTPGNARTTTLELWPQDAGHGTGMSISIGERLDETVELLAN